MSTSESTQSEETKPETPKKEEEYKIELLPEDYPQYDLSFKLIFIGDSSVGKSCLTTKAVKNNFEEYYQATVGFEFLTFNMKVNDKVIKLQIWDTCGQEIYKSLISNFYRNSSLAVLVYAIDNKESFTHVENWLNDLKSQANEDVRIFLVGNKSDLEEDRKVTKEEEYKIELLPEDYPQYDLSFKLIFIGDSSVGKSCLTTKAVKNNFEEYYQATVGFEFLTFNMKVNDKVIKLQIWDTCGQEIYKSLISNFYRNSSLAVLVYAIDNKESFTHVENWLNDLKSQASDDIRIFLVGNKSDLEEDRKVTREEGEKYKLDQHLDLFMETSAKTGQNARNVLVEAAKLLYNDYLKFDENSKKPEANKDNLILKSKKKEGKKCC